MFSNLTSIKLPNSFGPSLQGDKDGQGHLHLSVHVEPLDNPKSTALPDTILQRDASSWEYDLCLTVQSHLLPTVITPYICQHCNVTHQNILDVKEPHPSSSTSVAKLLLISMGQD